MNSLIGRLVCTLAALLGLTACTSGSTGAPPINQTNPHDPRFAVLQFAVGTANLYGNGNPALNVVSTLRQPDGTSATGVNTPSISGPFVFNLGPIAGNGGPPAPGGNSDLYPTIFLGSPSLPETSAPAPVISGTSQTIHPGTPFCDTSVPKAGFVTCPASIAPNDTTFGQSGGVFANGLAPFNAAAGSGQAYTYQPYVLPIFAGSTTVLPPATADTVHQFIPWGGPPAFDPTCFEPPPPGFCDGMGTRDGIFPILNPDNFGAPVFLGVGEGVTVFEFVTPHLGVYTLSTQIGTLGAGGAQIITSQTKTAQLSSTLLLPTLSTPVVTPDANGDGGATFTIPGPTLPAGVTEELVQIVNWGPGGGPLNGGASVGNCQGPRGPAFAPVYYTVLVRAPGVFQLGTLHGANTNLSGGATNLKPSHSICTLADNQSPPDGVPPASAGDNFTVEVLGFDYPAYEMASSLIQSTVPQLPGITGANGQADITISRPNEEDWQTGGTYTVTPLIAARHQLRAPSRYGRSAIPLLSGDVARRFGVPPQR